MSQDPVDDVLILNARDDLDGPTAPTENLYIDTEYALEMFSPLRLHTKKIRIFD